MQKSERHQALADFLRQRRARLAPSEVGLPPGIRRRTPGLRREEVAQLANIGTSWYVWLEQGREVHPSTPARGAAATRAGPPTGGVRQSGAATTARRPQSDPRVCHRTAVGLPGVEHGCRCRLRHCGRGTPTRTQCDLALLYQSDGAGALRTLGAHGPRHLGGTSYRQRSLSRRCLVRGTD